MAQLVAHLVWDQGVHRSSRCTPTMKGLQKCKPFLLKNSVNVHGNKKKVLYLTCTLTEDKAIVNQVVLKKYIAHKIGIKEIAIKAKVSIGTVDRVLHNRGEVAENTKQQVLHIINELGYTPNILAKSLASKKSYTIAVLIPEQSTNKYWGKPLQGIYSAAQEIKKYNFELQIATFDYNNENSFIANADNILKSKPDGFIFAPVYNELSLKLVKKCEKLQIPYVFFDVYIENCANLGYFGQNSMQSGYLAARLMNYSIEKGNKHIYIVKPVIQNAPVYHLNLREKGFLSFFSKNGINSANLHTLNIDISLPSNLYASLDANFSGNQKPSGIFVANSKVHLIAQYISEKNIKDVVLMGYDLLEDNIKFLEKGLIQFLICQKPEEQGYRSVLSLFNYLFLKKPIEKFNFSPIDIIMKENIEYYKNF